MQGSDLERVERKHAELEFSLREKENDICQNFSGVQNKLEQDNCVEVLEMESQLEEIGRLLREDEKLNKELRKVDRKVDNYYNRKDEANYNAMLDESVKSIVV